MGTLTETIQIILDADDRASKQFGAVETAIGGLIAAVSVSAIKDYAADLLDAAKRAEDLRSSLVFAAGGVDAAKVAFDQLRQIQRETGSGLSDLTLSWVRLKNLGLEPTSEALKAYVDIAAATPGKTTIDFVEAVADAITGEWTRVKEFGIKASVDQDNLTLKFKGTSLQVKNDAQSIQDALISIGKTEFGGAAAASAENLSKLTERLGESLDRLKAKVAEDSGLTAGTKSVVRGLTDLSDAFADPPQKVTVLTQAFDTATQAMSVLMNPFNAFKGNLSDVGTVAEDALGTVAGAVRELRGVGDGVGAAVTGIAEPLRTLSAEQMALIAATDDTAGAFGAMISGMTGADVAAQMMSTGIVGASDYIKKMTEDEKKNAEAAKKAEEESRKYALAVAELDAEIQKAQLEAYVSIKTTELETDAERVKSTFSSLDNSISNTGDLLGALFDNFSQAGSLRDKWAIEDQIDVENKRRQEALDLQKELAAAEIERIRAQTEALTRGDALIQIDGTGLEPELEAFMWQILKRIRVRANADFQDYLLGMAA